MVQINKEEETVRKVRRKPSEPAQWDVKIREEPMPVPQKEIQKEAKSQRQGGAERRTTQQEAKALKCLQKRSQILMLIS